VPRPDLIDSAVTATTRAIDAAVDAGERPPSLDTLAAAAHVSASHLRREFVARIGITPKAYADTRRAERLRTQLAAGSDVAAAIHGSGFGSTSRVYERSDELLGMSPASARKGAPGETIRYALADSSLGRLVVASTDRGVCLVAFGETDVELLADVCKRFPRAYTEPAGADTQAWVEAVVALVDDPSAANASRLPLDVRGTVFQRQVWAALRQIHAGETVTYSQLAAAIGRPTATRAVAAACGANPTAVVVPCHRVVGADGSLTGYRWGVERKAALLAREEASRR
jgi:AraC family transcriptional regulator, regulatory protein of adaptative response / methylated-DNA-[protein]-cysteine methyltransferase